MTTIRITPSLLNQVAARHESVADEMAAARGAETDILAAVATHGPIMHQFKAAAHEVVQRREAAFADHEAAHRSAADSCVPSQRNSRTRKRSTRRRFALTEQSFTAATPDNTIFVRVALAGHTLGVQIEPAAMKRPAIEIARGIMACNDVAYLKGQLVIRAELEGRSIPVDDMPTDRTSPPPNGSWQSYRSLMKVDVPGLVAAAQKLLGLATSAQGLLAETPPLASDPTSGGAAARLDMAALQLWGAACAQAYSLHTAAVHLTMIAAKFGGQEEINAAGLTMLVIPSTAADVGTLATLGPVPPIPPDVRVPLPPVPPLTGRAFSEQVTKGSAANGVGFSTTATNNGIAIDNAATTVREVAAAVPELWDSPDGTAALVGRLNEHVTALNAIADRWFELGDQARKHADDYSQTVSAMPKPREFQENEDALNRARSANNTVAVSQLLSQRGMLEQRALAEAGRYAGVTETTTSPRGIGTPQTAGAGAGGGGVMPTGAAAAGAASAPGGRTTGQGGSGRGGPGGPGRGGGRPTGAVAARRARGDRRYGRQRRRHGRPDPAGTHADRTGIGADGDSGAVRIGIEEFRRRRVVQDVRRPQARRAAQGQGRRRSGWRWGWRDPSGRCARAGRHPVDLAHGACHARRCRTTADDDRGGGRQCDGRHADGWHDAARRPWQRRCREQGARGQEGRRTAATAHRTGHRQGVRSDRRRRRGSACSRGLRRSRRRSTTRTDHPPNHVGAVAG